MGKAITFFLFMWIIVTMAGNIVQGSSQMGGTTLTTALNSSATTINVISTEGFPRTGILVIDSERVAYPNKTATTFVTALAQPMARGAESTTAASHSNGAAVRTIEGSMVNTAVSYNISVIADASGLWAGITIALAILRLLGSFLLLPISFFGTDLQIIGVIWGILTAGIILAIALQLAGARRVI